MLTQQVSIGNTVRVMLQKMQSADVVDVDGKAKNPSNTTKKVGLQSPMSVKRTHGDNSTDRNLALGLQVSVFSFFCMFCLICKYMTFHIYVDIHVCRPT